jgi:putative flippase GtrA
LKQYSDTIESPRARGMEYAALSNRNGRGGRLPTRPGDAEASRARGRRGGMTLARLPGRHALQMVRFLLVGAVGFVVDATILLLLTHELGVSPVWGRIPSLFIAITTTWWLHRHFTFAWAREVKPSAREWLRFALVNGAGNGANLALYWLLIGWFGWGILIALTVSSVVAAGINYGMTARWVFRRA